MKIKLLNLSVLMALFVGCATPKPNTQSVRPDITSTASSQVLESEIKRYLLADGWVQRSSDDLAMVFEHKTSEKNLWFANFATGNDSQEPFDRMKISVVDLGENRRVTASVFSIRQPGSSGKEVPIEYAGEELLRDFLKFLEVVKSRAEKR